MSGRSGVRGRPWQRLSPLTPLVRGLIYLVAGLAALRDDLLDREFGVVAQIVAAALVLGALYGSASWFLTRFWLAQDEVRVDTGVLHRRSRRVRIDRIQEIDLVQPLVARLFGLAEVRMDVAGGDEKEVRLAYLGTHHAEDVKRLLLARREEVRTRRRAAVSVAGSTASGGPGPGTGPRVLARVRLVRQLAALATTREAFGLLVGALILGWLVRQGGHPVVVSIAVPVVAGLGIILTRTLTENFGFALSEDHLGLHVRRGMFDLNTQTISVARLQGVVVTEPLVWRWLGWARLDVSTAGSRGVSSGGPAASTVLWVGERAEVMALAWRLLGVADANAVTMRRAPRRALLVAPLRQRWLAVGEHERLVAARAGALVRRTQLVPHVRVQSLRVRQGPWQRVLGLATVHLDSPPGSVRLAARHRLAADARALFEREVAASAAARRAVSSVAGGEHEHRAPTRALRCDGPHRGTS